MQDTKIISFSFFYGEKGEQGFFPGNSGLNGEKVVESFVFIHAVINCQSLILCQSGK